MLFIYVTNLQNIHFQLKLVQNKKLQWLIEKRFQSM